MSEFTVGKKELLKELKERNPDIKKDELEKIFDDLIDISRTNVIQGNVVGLVGLVRIFTKESKRKKVKNLKYKKDFISGKSRIVSVRVSQTLKDEIKRYDEEAE